MGLDDVIGSSVFSIFRHTPVSTSSWWAHAPRANFHQQCREQHADHMRGSQGERMVSNNSPNVLFDVSRARTPFHP